jgi:hypothetical protein
MNLPADHSDVEDVARTRRGEFEIRTAAQTRLTPQQLEQLTADGIEIPSLAELRALGDGTLAYGNQRVFVYIRDSALPPPQHSAGDEHWPRFHVANCERIRALRASGPAAWYVASAESCVRRKHLKVCRDCLGELQYEGPVHSFTVEHFYHLWPRELPEAQVTQTVLLDDFGGDFGENAAAAMALANYRCTRCGIDLSADHLRRFLHVHHKQVVKHDNPLSELVVLCIGCHANQSGHGLMRALLEFSEFSVLARR